jgi:hypothetical protein
MASATKAEQVAVYRAARLGIVYHPDRRAVTLKVSLGGGFSVRFGGGPGPYPYALAVTLPV